MIYIFIDESGDPGELHEPGATADFAMAACVCYSENIDEINNQIKNFTTRLKKKELKFSKFSSQEAGLMKKFLKKLNLEYFSVYTKKTAAFHGDRLLKSVFHDLVQSITVATQGKVKIFIDGFENAYFRKIYEPILRKKFPRSVMKFANSIKTPLIQVADFYAGYRRRVEKS